MTPLASRRTDAGLTPVQEEAAALLAVGRSVTEVARTLKIDRKTVYNWLRLSTFTLYYKKQLRDVRREVRGRLSAMAQEATDTLESLMRDGGEQAQLKAATYILDRIADDEKTIKKAKQKKGNEKG